MDSRSAKGGGRRMNIRKSKFNEYNVPECHMSREHSGKSFSLNFDSALNTTMIKDPRRTEIPIVLRM